MVNNSVLGQWQQKHSSCHAVRLEHRLCYCMHAAAPLAMSGLVPSELWPLKAYAVCFAVTPTAVVSLADATVLVQQRENKHNLCQGTVTGPCDTFLAAL